MNGVFRQVSPRALEILKQHPGMIGTALDWETAAPPDTGDPLAGLPASTRAIFACLPPEAQAMAAAQHARAMEQMRTMNPMLAALQAEEDEETAELRAAGVTDDDLPDALDIRKSWHPLHFLLAGTAYDPTPGAGQAVLGGSEVGDDHVYGPVRVLTAAETAEVAAALAGLSEEQLLARYDVAALQAAGIRGCKDDEDHREWMAETFREVRDYYLAARERGYGMLLAIV